ncbi:predicted protein [Nematostella vectensis]|uniref:Uncharacterized protein n=1 Tax=Nematostella vectensis TaxID=45351 RepID=A7S5A3_NEMVE|nr:predicted protein [Nematostella vectensis]|eukprot:XP_001633116.1 predicted protein [Nematostella vectensis]
MDKQYKFQTFKFIRIKSATDLAKRRNRIEDNLLNKKLGFFTKEQKLVKKELIELRKEKYSRKLYASSRHVNDETLTPHTKYVDVEVSTAEKNSTEETGKDKDPKTNEPENKTLLSASGIQRTKTSLQRESITLETSFTPGKVAILSCSEELEKKVSAGNPVENLNDPAEELKLKKYLASRRQTVALGVGIFGSAFRNQGKIDTGENSVKKLEVKFGVQKRRGSIGERTLSLKCGCVVEKRNTEEKRNIHVIQLNGIEAFDLNIQDPKLKRYLGRRRHTLGAGLAERDKLPCKNSYDDSVIRASGRRGWLKESMLGKQFFMTIKEGMGNEVEGIELQEEKEEEEGVKDDTQGKEETQLESTNIIVPGIELELPDERLKCYLAKKRHSVSIGRGVCSVSSLKDEHPTYHDSNDKGDTENLSAFVGEIMQSNSSSAKTQIRTTPGKRDQSAAIRYLTSNSKEGTTVEECDGTKRRMSKPGLRVSFDDLTVIGVGKDKGAARTQISTQSFSNFSCLDPLWVRPSTALEVRKKKPECNVIVPRRDVKDCSAHGNKSPADQCMSYHEKMNYSPRLLQRRKTAPNVIRPNSTMALETGRKASEEKDLVLKQAMLRRIEIQDKVTKAKKLSQNHFGDTRHREWSRKLSISLSKIDKNERKLLVQMAEASGVTERTWKS